MCIHSVVHAGTSNSKVSAGSITPHIATPSEDHRYLSVHSYPDICCMQFWIFVIAAEGPFSSDFSFSMVTTNEPDNGSCISPGSAGKMSQAYNWPACSKCKSQLAVAQPQENDDCRHTLSIPSVTHTQTCMKIIIIYFFFLRNDFIMGVIM